VQSPRAYLAGLVIDGSVVESKQSEDHSFSLWLYGARCSWCLLKAAAAPRATKVLGKHGASPAARPPSVCSSRADILPAFQVFSYPQIFAFILWELLACLLTIRVRALIYKK
jgi:hypothetical protein